MIFSTIIKESPIGTFRAEIHQGHTGYSIKYYNPGEELIKEENYAGRGIAEVAKIAQSWADGIQTLNG